MQKYQNVLKGMGAVMDGTLLETNARIKEEGRIEGRKRRASKYFLPYQSRYIQGRGTEAC